MTGLLSELNKESMEIKIHSINSTKIAEILSDEMIIQTLQNELDLRGNIY
jgi:hypothetical protein